jgi:hypothetical protein
MRLLTQGGIELFARDGINAPRLGGQAMHNDLTRISLLIALTAGAIYHIAVLVALAAVVT